MIERHRAEEIDATPAGKARAEDPLGKVNFFIKLAEAVPHSRQVKQNGLNPKELFVILELNQDNSEGFFHG
ncbi:hypothetical protein [Paraliobacillus salinarum]|uniref:hypothetical protein n=1 Tax=Paraliobacillus salinarum TaxID=1158996 RepID=UPI0015F6075A|nr:hypothetical protein [Paraliobacillus salinarum]